MIIARPTIGSWYQDELAISRALIESFVNVVESQAARSIHEYQIGRSTTISEIIHDGERFEQFVEEYQGLNSEVCDVKSVFEEYFPSLQRRSALLTVWGYFEYELNELCVLYKSEKSFELGFSDLYGDGIDRSTKYLEKVAGLNVHRDSQQWREIDKIREIRNKIAHQDAKLITKKGNPATELITYVDESQYLKNDYGAIVLMEGFLKHVVDLFNAYFRLISESIKARENA
jgi:hypothetical protein